MTDPKTPELPQNPKLEMAVGFSGEQVMLRDLFAAAALAGVMGSAHFMQAALESKPKDQNAEDAVATTLWAMADAMLRARERKA